MNKDRGLEQAPCALVLSIVESRVPLGLRPGLVKRERAAEVDDKVSASSFPTGENLLIMPSVAIEMPYFYISL